MPRTHSNRRNSPTGMAKVTGSFREAIRIYAKRLLRTPLPPKEEFFPFFLGVLDSEQQVLLQQEIILPWTERLNDDRGDFVRRRSRRSPSGGARRFDISRIAGELENLAEEDSRAESEIWHFFERVFRDVDARSQVTVANEKFDKIVSLLKLNSEEQAFLHFSYYSSYYPHFEPLLNSQSNDLSSLQIKANLMGVSPGKCRYLLRDDNRLENFGLVESSLGNFRGRDVLTQEFQSYLEGEGDSQFAEKNIRIDSNPAYPVDSYMKNPRDERILRDLLRSPKPCKILFYGAPGTGKTEYARSLLREVHSEFIAIQSDDRDRRRSDRMVSLVMANEMATETKLPILVDEAETVLNTGRPKSFFFFFQASDDLDNPKKQWVNEFIDESNAKMIFIVNSTATIHESTRRRFDYSIQFTGFSNEERLFHWNQALLGSRLEPVVRMEMRKRLATEFEVSAGGISSAIKTTEKVLYKKKLPDDKKIYDILEKALESHQELVFESRKKSRVPKAKQFDRSILNTDQPLSALEKSLESYYSALGEDSSQGSLCVLFHGKPGTGKTEYAKHLSDALGKPILVKSASSFLTPYVGMTERLLRDAFREAETKNAILFLDEADTFLGSRENAVRSWEVSQTNELLTCMENHRVVFIASTNLMDRFDSAAMRRFHWKIHFSALKPSAKMVLFEKYFGEFIGLKGSSGDSDTKLNAVAKPWEDRVKNIPELTPGDYRAVFNRLQYDSRKSDWNYIVEALETEVSYKKGVHLTKIGFS